MRFRILGPLEVEVDNELVDLGPKKQRSLFALLLINHGRVVSTDRILDQLWGEDAEGKENALWVYVSRLRAALGDASQEPILVTRDHGYSLSIAPETVDAYEFDQLAKRGASLVQADPDAAATDLRAALDLWRGRVLEEFEYDDFARSEIARLDQLRMTCLDNRIEADLKRGLSGELIGELEQLVDERPLDERPVSQLMLAQYRAGRQADALRCFERFRRGVGEELGLEPSPELRRLEEQILLHDSRLQARPSEGSARHGTATSQGRNPFRGLEAFREEDANLFFGRDSLVTDIIRRLDEHAIVSIVGSSGCGKSSAVRSGVVPAIRKGAIPDSDTWLIAQMVPGSNPFAELEAALLRTSLDAPSSLKDQLDGSPDEILRSVFRVSPSEDSRVAIVVDQFEELFTLCDESTGSRFLTALSEAAADPHGRVKVLITLRADFYDRPLGHPDFGRAMGSGVVNVVPMAPEQLEQAASQPAARAGVRLEPGLEAALISDVLGEPGALPLFQFTLTDLFDRRVGDTLTLTAYRDMGGIQGAVSRKAELIYERLTPDQKGAARQVFLRLVSISDGETRSRRRVEASELLELDLQVTDLQAVLDGFGQQRLLSFDRNDASGAPTVEVAHEALLEHWDRLATWIAEGKDDVLRNARLAAAANEWSESGRDDGYLLIGGRLENYEAWATASTMTLARHESEYLNASVALRDERLAVENERLARETAATRRAKRSTLSLIGIVGLVLVVGTIAIWLVLRPETTVAYVHFGGINSDINDGIALGFANAEQNLPLEVQDVPVVADPVGVAQQTIDAGAEAILFGLDYLFEVGDLPLENPNTDFILIDANFKPFWSNMMLLSFDHPQGAYLMGIVAAEATNTGEIALIGGWQEMYTETWLASYEQGAHSVDPSTNVRVGWTDDTGELEYDDPAGAKAVALDMYEDGVDVIFNVAGFAGSGIIDAALEHSAATDTHVWVIGVDADQRILVQDNESDYILTSMIKRYDVAIEESLASWLDGTIELQTWFNLENGGIEYSPLHDEVSRLSPILSEAETAIIAGEVSPLTETAVPVHWIGEADTNVDIWVDAASCTMQTVPTVEPNSLVEFAMHNRTTSPAVVGISRLSQRATQKDLEDELLQSGNAIQALETYGGRQHSSWLLPPGTSTTFRVRLGSVGDAGVVAVCDAFGDASYSPVISP